MKPHHSKALLRSYWLWPQATLNRCARELAECERPAWAVQRAIALWARRIGVDLRTAPDAPYASLQAFFLRELVPGTRPLQAGFVSPVDARVLATGTIEPDRSVWIKGQPLSLANVVGERESLRALEGGTYAVLFLSPDDYHHVHMPEAGCMTRARWRPGRYFPQNEAALREIARVHERNERVVLFAHNAQNEPFVLVMVGASLVGGIHLAGHTRSEFARPSDTPLDWKLAKGERLGHFAFGSTVVVLVPRAYRPSVRLSPGTKVQLGETLLVRTL